MSAQLRKITLVVPADLLERAMTATQEGVTPTVRRGLEAVAASRAYDQPLALEGQQQFSISVDQLRED